MHDRTELQFKDLDQSLKVGTDTLEHNIVDSGGMWVPGSTLQLKYHSKLKYKCVTVKCLHL